jgi:hypothetical protein
VTVTWDDFPGPRHQDEVMTSHEGQPSVPVQSQTHGAPMPNPDHGDTDAGPRLGP